MSEFNFKEIDTEGLDTLDAVAIADKFNHWMYQTILPYCKGNILEIGSGIGNISNFFLEDNAQITLSDIRDNYCEKLKDSFGHYPNLKGVLNMDLTDPDFETNHADLLGTFDTVFALNVVEHIKNDQLALRNCKKLLRRGGHVIILVPAYQWLYNRFDKELEHYRRYTKDHLTRLIADAQLLVKHSQYFNVAGMAGWFVSGKILKKKTIPKNQMSLYNKLVPIFKVVDKTLLNKVGLSVIAVGKSE